MSRVLPSWAANPFQSVEFLVTVGLLVSVLLGGAVVLFFIDRWRKRQLASSQESAESLSSFRAMYDRGELTEAEYQAVRDKMALKIKREVAATSMVTPTAPSPEPGPPGQVSGANTPERDAPPPPETTSG